MLCEGNKSRLPFCLVGGVGWGGKESLNHLLPERYLKTQGRSQDFSKGGGEVTLGQTISSWRLRDGIL